MIPYNEYDKLLGRKPVAELLSEKTMNWQLVNVTEEPEWVQDESGVYVIISRLPADIPHPQYVVRDVRLDLMRDNGLPGPIRSWQGSAKAVRKAVMQWLEFDHPDIGWLSAEHASYIGEQLALAAVLSDFVQD